VPLLVGVLAVLVFAFALSWNGDSG